MSVACRLRSGQYIVVDKNGKIHGRHGSDKAKCIRQARAINMTMAENEVKIFGQIGREVNANDVVAQLDSISGEAVIRINSPGGSVPEALAIFHAIQQRKEKTTIRVEGSAWSAAALLLAAADRVEMSSVGLIMLHDIVFTAQGSLTELKSRFEAAEKSRDIIVSQLAKRMNKNEKEILEMISGKEVWMDAKEALEAGMVDEIIETPEEVSLCVTNCVDIPKEYQKLIPSDGGVEMSLLDLAKKLGLDCKEDKAEETIVTAFKNLSEKKEEKKEEKTPIPATFLNMAKRDRVTRIDKLVEEFRITKAVADDLKIQFCADKALESALSEDGSATDSFEDMLTALGKNEPRLEAGESSGHQALKDEDNPMLKAVQNLRKEHGLSN